jgi:hypothetical protein
MISHPNLLRKGGMVCMSLRFGFDCLEQSSQCWWLPVLMISWNAKMKSYIGTNLAELLDTFSGLKFSL